MKHAPAAARVVILAAVALSLAACLGPQDRASLAQLEGEAVLPTLSAPVEVQRDRIGATRYVAETLADVARAQGFAHAQDRFAQMDILRRVTSGRLAELVGGAAVASDTASRRVGFHLAAQRALDTLPERHRELLDAYTEGVNAGLAALGAVPPEHRLLGVRPAPWQPLDCVHVAYTLSSVLLTGSSVEIQRAVLAQAYAGDPDTLAFLLPVTTRFDALAQGGNDYTPSPIPLPRDASTAVSSLPFDAPSAPKGSNNFAVSGAHTADGRAILAGDMHLALTMPPIWRHEHLLYTRDGEPRFAVGVALPGVPGIIAGSNGRVAWAFTNVTGDFADHAALELNPDNDRQYRTPGGYADLTTRTERIAVRGGSARTIEITTCEWGPVVGKDHRGRPLALRRSDISPEPINFALLDFALATTLEGALEVARAWNGPPQNVLVASDDGRIGWTLSGYLPARQGADGTVPLELAEGQTWTGPLEPAARPTAIDPSGGYLATANNRTVPAELAPRLGTQWDLGARAARIHERLREIEGAVTEPDLLSIQLDTRARVYEAFVPHVLAAIDPDDPNRRLRYARTVIERWDGRADAENREYRLVRWVGLSLIADAVEPFFKPATDLEARWAPGSPLDYVEPALRLLEEQPADHLPEKYESWRDLVRYSVLGAMDDIRESPTDHRLDAPWGDRITLRMAHPLSAAVQWLRTDLDMLPHPQSGDTVTVRVAAPDLGASQRLVVSPGREADSLFHMPGGQSGHPYSPFYRAGHDAWARGEARPLLPGPTAHRLTLVPAGR